MVANMATRPCLISVSRRLGDRQAVTRCHKKSKLSWSARRLATGHVFCIGLCCIICLMSIQHPTRPLEDFDILVCRKTKGVPKAEGCLVTHKPFEALVAWCIAHSTVYLLAWSVRVHSSLTSLRHHTQQKTAQCKVVVNIKSFHTKNEKIKTLQLRLQPFFGFSHSGKVL